MLAAVRALWLVLLLATIALLAALKLPTPLHGDTAMFLAGSRVLDDGGVLYRDFWDFKQPGIYWFYLAAGRLFGFSQLGVRCLDMLWQLALAALMTGCLCRYYDHRWLAGIAPLAGIGTYFAVATEWELTQVEILVALPTFLAAWLLSRSASSAPAVYALASGVCAGIAVVFKLALAPIVVAFLLLAVVHGVSGWPLYVLLRRLVAIGTPFAVGVVLVLAAVVVVYAARGALAEMLWSAFVFPGEVIRQGNALAPVSRLATGLVWCTAALLPWIVFTAVVVPAMLRGEESLFTKLIAAWVVFGLAAILLQRFSWWQYHFLVLFVPTAVLGVRGIDRLVGEWRPAAAGAWRPMAAALLFAVPALGLVANDTAGQLMQVKAKLRDEKISLEDYRRLTSRDYDRAAAVSSVIRASGDEGSIYVFGNPLILVLTGRSQSFPVNGWDGNSTSRSSGERCLAIWLAVRRSGSTSAGTTTRCCRRRVRTLWGICSAILRSNNGTRLGRCIMPARSSPAGMPRRDSALSQR